MCKSPTEHGAQNPNPGYRTVAIFLFTVFLAQCPSVGGSRMSALPILATGPRMGALGPFTTFLAWCPSVVKNATFGFSANEVGGNDNKTRVKAFILDDDCDGAYECVGSNHSQASGVDNLTEVLFDHLRGERFNYSKSLYTETNTWIIRLPKHFAPQISQDFLQEQIVFEEPHVIGFTLPLNKTQMMNVSFVEVLVLNFSSRAEFLMYLGYNRVKVPSQLKVEPRSHFFTIPIDYISGRALEISDAILLLLDYCNTKRFYFRMVLFWLIIITGYAAHEWSTGKFKPKIESVPVDHLDIPILWDIPGVVSVYRSRHLPTGPGKIGWSLSVTFVGQDGQIEYLASPIFTYKYTPGGFSDFNEHPATVASRWLVAHLNCKRMLEYFKQHPCDHVPRWPQNWQRGDDQPLFETETISLNQFDINGLEELVGLPDNTVTRFIKAVYYFLLSWCVNTTSLSRSVAFLRFLDDLIPFARECELLDKLRVFMRDISRFSFMRKAMAKYAEEEPSKASTDIKSTLDVNDYDSYISADIQLNGASAMSILNEILTKKGKPLLLTDFRYDRVSEQGWFAHLSLPDIGDFEAAGHEGQSQAELREILACQVLNHLRCADKTFDSVSVLNELVMKRKGIGLSSREYVYERDGQDWIASLTCPFTGILVRGVGLNKRAAREAVCKLIVDAYFSQMEINFSVNDVANFLRAIFNSSAVSSALKLVSFIFVTIFVARTGELDLKHYIDWMNAKSRPEVIASIGGNVLEHLVVLLTCSQEFFRTRDWRVFLRNETEVIKYANMVTQLQEEWTLMPNSDIPQDTMAGLLKKVEDHIAEGMRLSQLVKNSARDAFTKGIYTLRRVRMEIIAASRTASVRTAPFAVMLFGPPKIGKSSIISILQNQFRVFNPKKRIDPTAIDLDPGGVYTRTLKEPYWSGWQSWFWGVVMDDLGQTNPKVPEFALEINELIQVNNNVHFFPPMASVEEKGTVFVAPQLLIATTNNKTLNSYHAVVCPSAVARRLPFVITPSVKPEYAGDDGTLDGSKVGNEIDLWTFTVEEVVVVGNHFNYSILHQDIELHELLEWYNEAALDHFSTQANMGNFSQKLSKEEPCNHGLLKMFCRHCQVPQMNINFEYSVVMFLFDKVVYFAGLSACALTVLRYLGLWAVILRIQRILDFVLRFCVEWESIYGRFARFGQNCRVNVNILWARWRGRLDVAERWRQLRVTRDITFDLRSAYRYVGNRTFLMIATVLATTASVVLAMQVFSKQLSAEVNAVQGEKPVDSDVRVPNPYTKGAVRTFPEIMGGSAQTGRREDLLRHCTKALGIATIRGRSIRCLNIFGCYWLFPRHWLVSMLGDFEQSEKVDVVYASTADSPCPIVISCYIDRGCMHICPNNDFALVKLSCAPGANLLPWVLDVEGPVGVFHGDTLKASESGVSEQDMGPVVYVRQEIPKLTLINSNEPGTKYHLFKSTTYHDFVNGECGSILVSMRNGMLGLVGFHVATESVSQYNVFGTTVVRASYANALPKRWLLEMYRSLDVVVQSSVDLGQGVADITLNGTLHYKCPMHFEGLGDRPSTILPIGTLKVAQQNFVSAVRDNLFAPFWRNLGFVTNKVRPVLTTEKWRPKRNFLLNVSPVRDTIPIHMLRQVSDHFLNKVITLGDRINDICVIDEETNLYGTPGDDFINAMDFTTGAGFPFNKPKYKVLAPTERSGFPNGTYKLTPVVRSMIDEAESRLERGERANFVFNASLKDEPVSEKKMAEGKIRVFQALSFPGLFLLRKYFLCFAAFFQRHNLVCENAIGLDHSSPDWDHIYKHLRPGEGWRAFCGDYSNFDQRMGAQILEFAWMIVIRVCLMSTRYPKGIYRLLIGLVTECIYLWTNFFGDLFILSGSNPSGHALTVVINSIVNSLYMRLAWLCIFGDLNHFSHAVRLIVYGDDNVVSVHPDYQDKFNLVSVSAALAHFGIVYGDAAKTGVLQPFNDWSEITFLKRKFVVDELEGIVKAPLELASIHKMLLIGVDNRKVPYQDRLVSILRSSLDEMFHYGPVMFEEHYERVMRCIREYDLGVWVMTPFLSYSEYLERRVAKQSRIGVLDNVMKQKSTHGDSYQEEDKEGAGARLL